MFLIQTNSIWNERVSFAVYRLLQNLKGIGFYDEEKNWLSKSSKMVELNVVVMEKERYGKSKQTFTVL